VGNSVVLGIDPTALAALLMGHLWGGCAVRAACHRGAAEPIIDRVAHSRALSVDRMMRRRVS
jgi:hypothetical protein